MSVIPAESPSATFNPTQPILMSLFTGNFSIDFKFEIFVLFRFVSTQFFIRSENLVKCFFSSAVTDVIKLFFLGNPKR